MSMYIVLGSLLVLVQAETQRHEFSTSSFQTEQNYDYSKDQYSHHPNYKFEYNVHDPNTGDIKDQHESRDGDYVQGSYSLIEPDGSKRIVEYSADKYSGFNAIVRKEHGHIEMDYLPNNLHGQPTHSATQDPQPHIPPKQYLPQLETTQGDRYYSNNELPVDKNTICFNCLNNIDHSKPLNQEFAFYGPPENKLDHSKISYNGQGLSWGHNNAHKDINSEHLQSSNLNYPQSSGIENIEQHNSQKYRQDLHSSEIEIKIEHVQPFKHKEQYSQVGYQGYGHSGIKIQQQYQPKYEHHGPISQDISSIPENLGLSNYHQEQYKESKTETAQSFSGSELNLAGGYSNAGSSISNAIGSSSTNSIISSTDNLSNNLESSSHSRDGYTYQKPGIKLDLPPRIYGSP